MLSKTETHNALLKHGLPEHIVRTMIEEGEIKVVNARATICEIGVKCRDAFLVVEGAFIRQCIHPISGEEKTIDFHLPNYQYIITLIDSFFLDIPTELQIKCIEKATYLQLPRSSIDFWIEKDESYRNYYNREIVSALVRENNRMRKHIMMKPEEFYDYFMERFPQVIQNIPSKHIAEYIGISREWLSKIRSK